MLHLLADFHDASTKLMAQDDGVVHRPGVIRRPLMEVRATDADIGHLQQHILATDNGHLDFTDFYGILFWSKVDDGWGFHG